MVLCGDGVLCSPTVLQTADDSQAAREEELHKASLEEVASGDLPGPFSKEQMDGKFGRDAWLFTKRQGTPENPKVRVIDDRRSGLNSSYTANFKLELLDLDVLAAATSAVALALQSGTFDLGDNYMGSVSPAVMGKSWRGRTLDLSKSYKQLPISKDSQPLSVLGYSYKGQWQRFSTPVLPFGATAAIYGLIL